MPHSTVTTNKYTPEHPEKFGKNGHRSDGQQGLEARGRYSIPATAAPIICARGHDGRREWLSTAYGRQPPALERLLALLDHHDRKYFAPRRKSFAFPVPRETDVELIAQRWRLVGTPALRADRIARRQVCALELRTRTSRSISNARSELQVSEERLLLGGRVTAVTVAVGA